MTIEDLRRFEEKVKAEIEELTGQQTGASPRRGDEIHKEANKHTSATAAEEGGKGALFEWLEERKTWLETASASERERLRAACTDSRVLLGLCPLPLSLSCRSEENLKAVCGQAKAAQAGDGNSAAARTERGLSREGASVGYGMGRPCMRSPSTISASASAVEDAVAIPAGSESAVFGDEANGSSRSGSVPILHGFLFKLGKGLWQRSVWLYPSLPGRRAFSSVCGSVVRRRVMEYSVERTIRVAARLSHDVLCRSERRESPTDAGRLCGGSETPNEEASLSPLEMQTKGNSAGGLLMRMQVEWVGEVRERPFAFCLTPVGSKRRLFLR